MNKNPISPIALGKSLAQHRSLIMLLARREVLGRYRGSVLGLLWSFFHPLLMLAVYTFVFSVVFEMRWPGGDHSRAEFALVLFIALISFNLFAECVNRAPGLILANPNYVTKVLFPLETLPIVVMLSALFHAAIGVFVWLVFAFFVVGVPPATIFLLPLVWMPLVLYAIGVSWFLASLGAYLRDVSQIVSVMTTVLLFLSPIFYSIDSVPVQYRGLMHANPLADSIEQIRGVMIWGQAPDWMDWSIHLCVSLSIAWLGFTWFQKTRGGFSDVL